MSSSTLTSLQDDDTSIEEHTPLFQHADHNGSQSSLSDDVVDIPKETETFDRKRLYRVFPALAIASFLAAADQTIVVSSHSKIGSELGALSQSSWLATG